jgi:hypothetical protein
MLMLVDSVFFSSIEGRMVSDGERTVIDADAHILTNGTLYKPFKRTSRK